MEIEENIWRLAGAAIYGRLERSLGPLLPPSKRLGISGSFGGSELLLGGKCFEQAPGTRLYADFSFLV